MPASYDLVNDYNSPDTAISMAPVWVMAVVRWSHPFLFNREQLASFDTIDAFEQQQDALVIVSDCSALDISANKGAHVTNLTATLRDNNINYLSAIFPDDWLFAWILPNETRAKDLVKRIRSHQQCNGFLDGLRFFGRVQTLFKDTVIDDKGAPTSIFSLTGVGFGEFDYTLFWEPKLVDSASLPVWFSRLGVALNNIIAGKDKSVMQDDDPHAIDVNKMIPALVRLTLGEGPFQVGNLAVPGGANASPNGGVRVPSLVGKFLGMDNTEELTFSDVVDIVVGVQKYRGAAGAPANSPLIFQPDGLQDTSTELTTSRQQAQTQAQQPPFLTSGGLIPLNPKSTTKNFVELTNVEPTVAEYQTTGIPLLGEFPIVQLPFQDTPIWQIMENYLNPAVNEMYVALKPDEFGDVFPRLTVRQYPFNTRKFEAAQQNVASTSTPLAGSVNLTGDKPPTVTTFLELPRWVIHPKMLKRIQVGRSNTLRTNFWNIQGTGPGTAIDPSLQYVRSPPISDEKDIERSGLRRAARTVNCLIKDATQGPDLWRNIIADITSGQHLVLTGTIQTVGIIAPVAPGDNVQFANVVYHVEGVRHSCSMAEKGMRQWVTILQVSHGMADDDTLATNQNDAALDPPLQEYAGVRNADPATIRVGRSVLDLFEEGT